MVIGPYHRGELERRGQGSRFASTLLPRAVAGALIGGGGGCIFIYLCSARLISFEIN